MTPVAYYQSVIRKYAEFEGRASRSEFWWFVLVNAIISTILAIVDYMLGVKSILQGIYGLLVLCPAIAVGIRRLHDTGKSGWWYLLVCIPIIGWIVLLIFYVKHGEPGTNKYGPNPNGAMAASAPASTPAPAPAAPVTPAATEPAAPADEPAA